MRFLEQQEGLPDLRILEVGFEEENALFPDRFLSGKEIEIGGRKYLVYGDSLNVERKVRSLRLLIFHETGRGLRGILP